MESVYINIQGLSLKEDYKISKISWKGQGDQPEDYIYDVTFSKVRRYYKLRKLFIVSLL